METVVASLMNKDNVAHGCDTSIKKNVYKPDEIIEVGCVTCLEPEKLMTIRVGINNQVLQCLLDSGATNSLIKESQWDELKCANNVLIGGIKIITGLGDAKLRTLGSTDLTIDCFGKSMKVRFEVVEDDVMQHDAILGLNFLKEHKIFMNVNRRIVGTRNSDGSVIKVVLDEGGDIKSTIVERVPVLSEQRAEVPAGESREVPFKVSYALDLSAQDLLFEGEMRNRNVVSIDGIVSNDKLKTIIRSSNNKEGCCIAEGTYLGTVSTLAEKDYDEDEKFTESVRTDNYWGNESLSEEVKMGDNTTSEQKAKVLEVLHKCASALSTGDSDIGLAKVPPHSIELTNRTPIWQKPRTFADPVNTEIENQCKELLAHDILELSDSNWSSPIVPVRKPDGQLRLCIDYRKVNSVTITQRFPMPNLNNCIYKGHNVRYFTKIDLVRGYYQVPLDKKSRPFTAFSTQVNHYQFKRLSFGLKNSGIAFQKMMQQILSQFMSNNIIIYIDDVLILSETFDEHLILLEKVLTTLGKFGIKIKLKKCEFATDTVEFLGHIIDSSGIRKSPEFVEKVNNFPRPTTITQMRQFLGLINFQRKFIQNCSTLTKPLSEIVGGPKRKLIEWTEEQNEAFERLKEEIRKEITLSYPDYRREAEPLELYVDASGTGAGACLLQLQNGQYKTIGYASMSFSSTQRNYSTIDRELTAIRWGVQAYKGFLYGVKFLLFTDHRPLIYLQNMAVHNSRMRRTLEELAEYEFDIKYRPGKENQAADYLSRLESGEESVSVPGSHKYLPEGLKIICKMEGGGDSMCEALLVAMRHETQNSSDLPESHSALRSLLVSEMLANPGKYGVDRSRDQKKIGKIMLNEGTLLCPEVLLVACEMFNLEIRVYHGMDIPVIFKRGDPDRKTVVIRLQCVSMIHYNPVCLYKKEFTERTDKYVNVSHDKNNREINLDEMSENLDVNLFDEVEVLCGHDNGHLTGIAVGESKKSFCCLLDTGAQISLMSDAVLEILKDLEGLEIQKCEHSKVSGVGNGTANIIGYVCLDVKLANEVEALKVPFAIVERKVIPCCFILGINAMRKGEFTLDFDHGRLKIGENLSSTVSINFSRVAENLGYSMTVENFSGDMNESGEEDCVSEEISDLEVTHNIVVDRSELSIMQKRDFALSRVRTNVERGIPADEWKLGAIQKFRRHARKFKWDKDLLVLEKGELSPVIISFRFMVEVLYKIHEALSHIGRHKLLQLVRSYFWHPDMEQVARDICAGCGFCQLYKTNSQVVVPPTVKMKANYPFALVAVDLLQFPKSSKNNVTALVAVDHCSKWLSVVPLKDKRAATVARALDERILPFLAKMPSTILSDNGKEFVAQEFENVLHKYGIKHIFTTPYSPSSNGACERVNSTILNFVRGLRLDQNRWDEGLVKAVVTYNNTSHSQIGTSPSQFILQQVHSCIPACPIDNETRETWREGHPNFAPFRVGQKVIKKIVKTGNRVEHKLSQKFDGPFVIKKVQQNGVTYEIGKENSSDSIRAHHKQLRPWRRLPDYISKILNVGEIGRMDANRDMASPSKVVNREVIEIFSQTEDCEDVTSGEDQINMSSGDIKCKRSQKRKVLDSSDKLADGKSTKLCVNRNERKTRFRKSKVGLQLKERLNLSRFHCTEMVDNSQADGLPMHSTPITRTGDHSNGNGNVDFVKYLRQYEEDLKLISCFESVLDSQSNLLEKAFASGKHESTSLQKELEVSSAEGEHGRLDISEHAGIGRSLHDVEVVEVTNESNDVEVNSVHGLECSKGNQCNTLLSDMKSIIQTARKKIEDRRRESEEFRQCIWEHRMSLSIHSNSSGLAVPLGNKTNGLNESPLGTPGRMLLRSRGKLADTLPRVQPKVLEYKSRAQRKVSEK